eukprot:scaffold256484_cov23-Tisochrysis_lutea.AAC.1
MSQLTCQAPLAQVGSSTSSSQLGTFDSNTVCIPPTKELIQGNDAQSSSLQLSQLLVFSTHGWTYTNTHTHTVLSSASLASSFLSSAAAAFASAAAPVLSTAAATAAVVTCQRAAEARSATSENGNRGQAQGHTSPDCVMQCWLWREGSGAHSA